MKDYEAEEIQKAVEAIKARIPDPKRFDIGPVFMAGREEYKKLRQTLDELIEEIISTAGGLAQGPRSESELEAKIAVEDYRLWSEYCDALVRCLAGALVFKDMLKEEPKPVDPKDLDADLKDASRDDLLKLVMTYRGAIREHRDCTGHDLCWYKKEELWDLLPEKVEIQQKVPTLPDFMKNCAAYWQTLPKS